MTKNSKPRFFYGYVIVTASFFIALILHGMNATYGVFFTSLQSEFGSSRAIISGANSLAFFLIGVFSILTGWLTDRFSPRRVLVTYGIIFGVGYLLMSRVDTVWQLYLSYGLVVSLATSAGDPLLLPTTARWFVRRRGIMSAIVKVGSGTGILIMPLTATWLILSRGWRSTYLVLALFGMAVIIAAAQLMKRDPTEKGLHPYGVPQGGSRKLDSGGGHSFREAIHTKQLWVVCITYFLVWYCAHTIMVHMAPHALDLKASASQAAGMLSLIGAGSIVGRLLMGGTADRVGSRRALIITFAVLVAALSWLLVANSIGLLYLFAGIYGFAHGSFFALVSPLLAELFGVRSLGIILGMVLAFGQAGGAVGPIVAGHIFDVTGSYQLAFIVMLIAAAIGLILSTLLKPVKASQ